MCGIVGVIGGDLSFSERRILVERMKQAVRHRGPDDDGFYQAPDGLPVALGHRRLAIIDPQHGAQPMVNDSGEVAIVFNGVIYNYLELRRDLIAGGSAIKSYSDTEVLLHAYMAWGTDCLDRLRGMFAFAIWDGRRRQLFCARDRIGIKPFYYAFDGNQLLFGSEIKALLVRGGIKAVLDQRALSDYVTYQFTLGERTLFRGVRKLEPGYSLLAIFHGEKIDLKIRQYWDATYNINEGVDESFFIDNLSMKLDAAVALHLRSDVPVGAYLSGGLDSSLVACLAARDGEGVSFSTFNGAFDLGPAYDESEYAKIVAEHIGSSHHSLYISPSEFADVLPRLIFHMDEPAAGPGLLPQYFVSRAAAQHVKVVLGGQGGDEIFVGYARYLVAYLERCLYSSIFEIADERKYAVSLTSIVPNLPLLQGYRPLLQSFWREGLFDSEDRRYFQLVDRSDGLRGAIHPDVFQHKEEIFSEFQQKFWREGLGSLVNRMTYFDLKSSLPALLQVEDRMSMAVSLESRV